MCLLKRQFPGPSIIQVSFARLNCISYYKEVKSHLKPDVRPHPGTNSALSQLRELGATERRQMDWVVKVGSECFMWEDGGWDTHLSPMAASASIYFFSRPLQGRSCNSVDPEVAVPTPFIPYTQWD